MIDSILADLRRVLHASEWLEPTRTKSGLEWHHMTRFGDERCLMIYVDTSPPVGVKVVNGETLSAHILDSDARLRAFYVWILG